jgi:hypothetical protein
MKIPTTSVNVRIRRRTLNGNYDTPIISVAMPKKTIDKPLKPSNTLGGLLDILKKI